MFDERYAMSDRRLAICKECEYFIPKTSKCDKCGCFMEYKTLIKSSTCPINKWGKEIEVKNNGE